MVFRRQTCHSPSELLKPIQVILIWVVKVVSNSTIMKLHTLTYKKLTNHKLRSKLDLESLSSITSLFHYFLANFDIMMHIRHYISLNRSP